MQLRANPAASRDASRGRFDQAARRLWPHSESPDQDRCAWRARCSARTGLTWRSG